MLSLAATDRRASRDPPVYIFDFDSLFLLNISNGPENVSCHQQIPTLLI